MRLIPEHKQVAAELTAKGHIVVAIYRITLAHIGYSEYHKNLNIIRTIFTIINPLRAGVRIIHVD